jgi:hypothetical protein
LCPNCSECECECEKCTHEHTDACFEHSWGDFCESDEVCYECGGPFEDNGDEPVEFGDATCPVTDEKLGWVEIWSCSKCGCDGGFARVNRISELPPWQR